MGWQCEMCILKDNRGAWDHMLNVCPSIIAGVEIKEMEPTYSAGELVGISAYP